ncbi:divIVA domain-containing protein [Clostridium sp. CAG:628]|jgi:cell division initiation protein|nr:divIVA domain-containing protein [Clostridium sp. CAG:628]
MNGFNTVFRGYDKEEVKKYLDKVIKEYERLLNEKKIVDEKVNDLSKQLEKYEQLESTLNRALFSAENASDEIKRVARLEAEGLINEAKRNANRIINDALIKAEKANDDADRLKRNVTLLKKRLRAIIEGQLEVIEEMDRLDFKNNE